MSKVEKTLIFLSNLAIPSNDKVKKGLGDLLEFDASNNISIFTKTFIVKNHDFLVTLSNYLNINVITYENLIENLYSQEDISEVKYFFEEFRVFATKIYFSHPYVIDKLNLFENYVYDKIEKVKDDLILDSLKKNNDKNK